MHVCHSLFTDNTFHKLHMFRTFGNTKNNLRGLSETKFWWFQNSTFWFDCNCLLGAWLNVASMMYVAKMKAWKPDSMLFTACIPACMTPSLICHAFLYASGLMEKAAKQRNVLCMKLQSTYLNLVHLPIKSGITDVGQRSTKFITTEYVCRCLAILLFCRRHILITSPCDFEQFKV